MFEERYRKVYWKSSYREHFQVEGLPNQIRFKDSGSKRRSSCMKRLVNGKNRLNEGQLPEWMSQGATELNNDLYKRKSAEKYCPALFGTGAPNEDIVQNHLT